MESDKEFMEKNTLINLKEFRTILAKSKARKYDLLWTAEEAKPVQPLEKMGEVHDNKCMGTAGRYQGILKLERHYW